MRSYGPWESFPVTIIKDGITTNLLLYKRRKPNGSWEFKDTAHPVITMLKTKEIEDKIKDMVDSVE